MSRRSALAALACAGRYKRGLRRLNRDTTFAVSPPPATAARWIPAPVQSAIDACGARGGSPFCSRHLAIFVTGSVYLKHRVTLEVEAGARITGSTDLRDYSTDTGSNPYYPEPID
jgi:polygalacturonase